MPLVGKRVLGHSLKRQYWFECAVSGLEYPADQTVVPEHPHPQAGLRVSLDFYDDELDRDTLRLINGPPEIGDDNLDVEF